MTRALLIACMLMSACESPTVPVRVLSDVYDFRLLTPEPVVLRWPTNSTVRFFAVADADAARTQHLRDAVSHGVGVWNQAALYGEIELAEAGSVQEADVVVRYSNVTPPIDLSNCGPVGGVAVTTFCLTDNELHLRPFPLANGAASNVKFVITLSVGLQSEAELVRRLVTHEMGHVLGLAQHSPDQTDLMFFDALSRSDTSPADRATLQVLYHTVPDITP